MAWVAILNLGLKIGQSLILSKLKLGTLSMIGHCRIVLWHSHSPGPLDTEGLLDADFDMGSLLSWGLNWGPPGFGLDAGYQAVHVKERRKCRFTFF